MSDGTKIYWRLRQDVKDGSFAWQPGWIIGRPAQGLIEIGDIPGTYKGVVMSENDIVYKVATV